MWGGNPSLGMQELAGDGVDGDRVAQSAAVADWFDRELTFAALAERLEGLYREAGGGG